MARRKKRLSRLMRDVMDSDAVEKLMKRHRGVDFIPVAPDTRLSALAGSGIGHLPIAFVRPVVATSSDHVRVDSPNREEADAKMRHHRIKR